MCWVGYVCCHPFNSPVSYLRAPFTDEKIEAQGESPLAHHDWPEAELFTMPQAEA